MLKLFILLSSFFTPIYVKATKATNIKHMHHSTFYKRTKHMYKNPKALINTNSNLVSLKNRRANSTSLLHRFLDENGAVKQAAVEHFKCGLLELSPQQQNNEDALSQKEITDLAYELYNSITLLNKEQIVKNFSFKGRRNTKMTTALSEIKNPYIRQTRMKKGKYKCDSTGGSGYRFDIFFKVAK